jgi:uncharacterized membrane protein YgcG
MLKFTCPYCKEEFKSNVFLTMKIFVAKHNETCLYRKQHLVKGVNTASIVNADYAKAELSVIANELSDPTSPTSIYSHSIHDEDVYTKPDEDTFSGGGGESGGGGASGSWD